MIRNFWLASAVGFEPTTHCREQFLSSPSPVYHCTLMSAWGGISVGAKLAPFSRPRR
jgi:hypothetical protein